MTRRYLALSAHLRQRFGQRVRSVALDAGFTCPNVDGSITTGGCVYCDNRSFSPNRRLPRATLTAQIDRSIAILTKRFRTEAYVAYFQAGTNTHGPVDKLQRLFDQAIAHPKIVALAIGTRPDSVPDPVLDLLQSYTQRLPVFLELGLQTVHDRSLEWMNRGHSASAFVDAVRRCEGRGLDLSAHVILGLPGESHDDMMLTADVLAGLPVNGVKIHNLYVVRDTPLEQQYHDGSVRILPQDEYVELVVDFLERTPAGRVIHRLNGEAPEPYLIAPQWVRDKEGFLKAVDEAFVRRGTQQGSNVRPRPMPGRVALPMV